MKTKYDWNPLTFARAAGRLLALALMAAILLAGNSAAATITYVLTGNLTGTLGNTTLNGNSFQFTITNDISGEVPVTRSNSVYLSGIGAGTFNPVMSFSFGGSQGGYIQDIGIPFPVVQFTSAGLTGWNGFSPIGPVPATQSSPGSWTSVNTSLGTLSVTSMTNVIFSATNAAAVTPPTVVTPSPLPSGTIGVFYAQTLAASGGSAPYSWSLVSGSPPAGLSLSNNGAIAGMPTALGTVSFTVKVTDAASLSAMQTFNLTIGATQSFDNALRISQLVDGAGWRTRFAIVNTDQVPVTFTFRFWGGNGNAMPFPILNGTSGVLTRTLAPGSSYFADSPGTSATLLQGWAEVASGGRIGVTAIYQFSVGSPRDSTGTEIASLSSNNILMPFDNTQGNVAGIAVANTNATQSLTVTMQFETEDGVRSTTSFILQPHGQQAFVSSAMSPAIAGVRGSIRFTAATPDIAVTGLEFTANGQFSSLGTFQ